jgi:hypothetical protein
MSLIRAIGIVLGVLAVLALLYLWRFDPLAFGRPKDQDLIGLLRAHREAFERLSAMGLEDAGAMTYLSEDTLKQSSLSEDRRGEYMRLLSGIRHDLVMRLDPNEVSFSYSGGGVGLAIARSWMKGIAYLPHGTKKIGPTVSSLDKVPASSDGVHLMPIEGNWYLVYSNLD